MAKIKKFDKGDSHMKISDLIRILEEMKQEHGDLNCATETMDGGMHSYMEEDSVKVKNAQVKGPKSHYSEECLVISLY